MRNIKCTLLLGILAILTLTPSCSKSSGSNNQALALAAIMLWTNPVAQYLLPRHGTFPREIENIVLQHNGTVGDVAFDFSDPSGALVASPASGVLKPGQKAIITIAAVALIAYTTVTMTMHCNYLGGLSAAPLVVPFAFALMPPAMYVMSILSGSDPLIPNLFLAALVFGLIGVVVRHSGKNRAADRKPLLRYTEIVLMLVLTVTMSLLNIAANFAPNKNTLDSATAVNFPPGQGPIGYTIHANMEVDMVAGEFYMFHAMMQDPIPLQDPETKDLHTYAFVLDSDGNAANDWTANPNFPNDFWQGTDRWYEITYSDAGGWKMIVEQIGPANSRTEVASAARAIIVDDSIVLIVPKTEVPGPNAKWRTSTFVHQGDFGANPPYLWSGDVEPAIGKPLLDVK